jgi:hypothetical protein
LVDGAAGTLLIGSGNTSGYANSWNAAVKHESLEEGWGVLDDDEEEAQASMAAGEVKLMAQSRGLWGKL